MNRLAKPALALALSLTLCLTVATTALAQTFEGTLEMAISTQAQKTDATGYMKGLHFKILPKANLKMEGGVEGYPMLNFETKKVTLLAPTEKYFLDMPMASLEATIDKAIVKFKKSGKTDTVSGHPVEEFVLDDAASKYSVSLWATKDFASSVNFLISIQKSVLNEGVILGRMGKDLIAQGYFPLKAEAKDAKGKVTVSMLVSNLTPKKLDDKEFAIPDGFVKMSDYLKKKKSGKP